MTLTVAFDEDFEAELTENHEAKIEVSCLANVPEPGLAEVSTTFSFVEVCYNFYLVMIG